MESGFVARFSLALGKRTGCPLSLFLFLRSLLCSFFGRSRGELEADLGGLGVEGEMGGEGAFGLLGDEAGEEVGLACSEHFFDVGGGEFLLEDRLAEAEAVGAVLAGELRDHEGFFGFVELRGLSVGEGDFLDELVVGEVIDGFEVGIEDEVELPFSFLAGFGNGLCEFQRGFEGTVEAGDEAVALFEEFRGEESGGFFGGEEASCDILRDTEATFGFAAFVGGIGLLELGCSAVRADAFEIIEGTRDDFFVVTACFFDDAFGELFNLVHEGVTGEFSFFHAVKLGLPVAGHFGAGEGLDFHFFEEVDEADALAGGNEFATITGEVFLTKEAFNRSSTSGWGAKATLGHGFAEFVVIDEFSGAFHRGEEGGFSKASRWVGLLFEHLDGNGLGVFAFLHDAEFILASADAGLASVDGEPAGNNEDFTIGAEGVFFRAVIDGGDALGDLEFGVGEEDGEEALHDHVVKFRGGFIEFDDAAGGDDGEVIGNFRVIKDALLEFEAVVFESVLGPVGEVGGGLREVGDDLLHVLHVVLGEVAGIGSRIGDHFVTLVESLGEAEGVLRGKGSFPLESGEVVELRSDLLGGLFLLGDDAGFSLAALGDEFGLLFIPDALGAAVGLVFALLKGEVDPLSFVFSGGDAEVTVDFGVRGGFESLDFLFALREDGEGGSLNATSGGDIKTTVAGAEAGQGASGVEANEPVGFGAALCGIGEIGHFLTFAEAGPGVLDRTGGHGLHPEALYGFIDLPVIHDVLEDEFTFAAGITGVYDLGDVFFTSELEDVLEAAFGLLDRLEGEFRGDGGKDIELPREVLTIGSGGHFELDEVTDGGGDHGLVVLEILGITGLSLLLEFPESFGEGFGEIRGNGGLLSDDKSLGHEADLGLEGGGWEGISFGGGGFRRKNF